MTGDRQNEVLPKRHADRGPMKMKITPIASASARRMRLTRTISIWSGEIVSTVAWVSYAGRKDERLSEDERGVGEDRVAALRELGLGLVACLGVPRCRQRLVGDGRVVPLNASTRRQSEGRMSPPSSRITSPGTSWARAPAARSRASA